MTPEKGSRYYVLDTNVLIDYPDIIPNGDNHPLDQPNIDFTGAHIVVPTAVIRELGNHKGEMSDRGVACRKVLRRIRKLTENANASIKGSYNLDASIPIRGGTEYLDILPVHKDFISYMPFAPADTDMDGQITLATMTTQLIVNNLLSFNEEGLLFNKTSHYSNSFAEYPTMDKNTTIPSPDSVILLTNDNGLAIRAHARGIHTARFNYHLPQPYTGRRDLTVPPEVFEQFFLDGCLNVKDFALHFPNEPPLVANEYIVMYPKDDIWPGSFDLENDGDRNYRYVARYNAYARVLEPLKPLSGFPTEIKNAGQAMYADALMDSDIDAVICIGPAGSGKTYMATIYAYDACGKGGYIGVAVVPCRVQDDGVGYLPGGLDEKLDPSVQPIKNALRNYLLSEKKEYRRELENLRKFGATSKDSDEDLFVSDKKKKNGDDSSVLEKKQRSLKARLDDNVDLIYDNWFGDPIPIAYTRGRDFAYQIAFYDEFQDHSNSEAINLLTRIGKCGKIIATGDIEQVHAPYLDRENNGLTFTRNLLKGLENVAQITYHPGECVRHRLVKAILERLSGIKTPDREPIAKEESSDIEVEIFEKPDIDV